ncbi:hypothetical protein HL42_3210 [Trichophyton rubrum]|nr:hypothetical protein HL42_3210 [Trichophyton rubrum]
MEDNKITGLIPANSTAEWEKRGRVHRAIIEKWIVFGTQHVRTRKEILQMILGLLLYCPSLKDLGHWGL